MICKANSRSFMYCFYNPVFNTIICEKKHIFIEAFECLNLTTFIATFSKSIIKDLGFEFWFNDLRLFYIYLYTSSFLSGRKT